MSTRILKEPLMPRARIISATTDNSIIKIQPNGTVEVISSTMPIFLGRQHDKNVLSINIDVSQLLTEQLTLQTLLDHYTPYLIFKLGEKKIKLTSTTVQESNIVFTITEEITNITDINIYNIIFTLNEKGADGNVANETEYFTSAMFQGKVEPSMYEWFMKADLIDITDQEGLLKKPTIPFDWDNWNFTLTDTAAILGYNQDRYITDATMVMPPQINDTTAASYLLFYNAETKASFKHKLTDGQTFLAPQITTQAGTWDVSLAIIGNNQKLFSNSVPLKVLDNTLNETDLEEINHQLLKDTRNSQLVAANNPLEPTIFTLKYDGPTINQLLNRISISTPIKGNLKSVSFDEIQPYSLIILHGYKYGVECPNQISIPIVSNQLAKSTRYADESGNYYKQNNPDGCFSILIPAGMTGKTYRIYFKVEDGLKDKDGHQVPNDIWNLLWWAKSFPNPDGTDEQFIVTSIERFK